MSHDFQSCDMNQYLSKSLQFDIFQSLNVGNTTIQMIPRLRNNHISGNSQLICQILFYQMAEMLEHMSEYLYDFTEFIFASIRCTIPNFQTCEQFCCSLYVHSACHSSDHPTPKAKYFQ